MAALLPLTLSYRRPSSVTPRLRRLRRPTSSSNRSLISSTSGGSTSSSSFRQAESHPAHLLHASASSASSSTSPSSMRPSRPRPSYPSLGFTLRMHARIMAALATALVAAAARRCAMCPRVRVSLASFVAATHASSQPISSNGCQRAFSDAGFAASTPSPCRCSGLRVASRRSGGCLARHRSGPREGGNSQRRFGRTRTRRRRGGRRPRQRNPGRAQ